MSHANGDWPGYFEGVLLGLDQFANTLLRGVLNMLVRPGGARFGWPDETLSSVLGKNARAGTCPVCSWICRWVLHPIDRHHCEDAIEEDEGDVRG